MILKISLAGRYLVSVFPRLDKTQKPEGRARGHKTKS